jgi:nucleolin
MVSDSGLGSVVRDRMTGESKGSGFVEFKNAEAATEALEALKDQKDPSTGRQMIIKYAQPSRFDSASDLKSKPEWKKQRFNQREKGPRRRNSHGGDWNGPQRTEEYRDS